MTDSECLFSMYQYEHILLHKLSVFVFNEDKQFTTEVMFDLIYRGINELIF